MASESCGDANPLEEGEDVDVGADSQRAPDETGPASGAQTEGKQEPATGRKLAGRFPHLACQFRSMLLTVLGLLYLAYMDSGVLGGAL